MQRRDERPALSRYRDGDRRRQDGERLRRRDIAADRACGDELDLRVDRRGARRGRSSDFARFRSRPAERQRGVQPFFGRLFGCGSRSEEHTSELQSLMRISYAVFCLKKKNKNIRQTTRITKISKC